MKKKTFRKLAQFSCQNRLKGGKKRNSKTKEVIPKNK